MVLVALSKPTDGPVVDVVRTVVPAGVLLVWPGIELGLGSLAAGCTDPPLSITLYLGSITLSDPPNSITV